MIAILIGALIVGIILVAVTNIVVQNVTTQVTCPNSTTNAIEHNVCNNVKGDFTVITTMLLPMVIFVAIAIVIKLFASFGNSDDSYENEEIPQRQEYPNLEDARQENENNIRNKGLKMAKNLPTYLHEWLRK